MTSDVQHPWKLLAINLVRHVQCNVDRQIHAPYYSHDQLSKSTVEPGFTSFHSSRNGTNNMKDLVATIIST